MVANAHFLKLRLKNAFEITRISSNPLTLSLCTELQDTKWEKNTVLGHNAAT